MKSVSRLIRICCYYNSVKYADFYNVFSNVRIKDTRAIVFHILHNVLQYNKYQISDLIKMPISFVDEHLKYHEKEIELINHYKKLYYNTLTQFQSWNNAQLDLPYSIVKTKYDYEQSAKYEQILNDNNRLEHEIDILKFKLKKRYV